MTTLYVYSLLLPLLFVFMQGPSVSAELAMGAALALGGLFQMRTMAELRRIMPCLCVLVVYIVLAAVWNDPLNDLSGKYTLGLLCYLFPAGLVMGELVGRGKGDSVLLAFALFLLCLASVGWIVLRTVGVENLVKNYGIELSRSNIENETFTYLKIFKISNVIVGMSVFGLCPLVGSILCFVRTSVPVKVVAGVAFGIAIYVNIQVLTRGALVASGLTLILMAPLIMVSMPPRRMVAVSLTSLLVLVLVAVAVSSEKAGISEKVQGIVQRISETGSDTRLIHWHEAMGLIERMPMGGGRRFMQTHYWAHNLFLDAALSTGVIGALSIAAIFGLTALYIGRALLRIRKGIDPAYIVFAAQFISVFVFCMTGPPSLPLFGVVLLCAGFFSKPVIESPIE